MTRDVRDRYIARVVGGKSFADVGGLYEIVKEKVSTAHRQGATRSALIDIEPPDCVWWGQMREHLSERGVTNCELISGDVTTLATEPFDVVYASGTLYHAPSPLHHLDALRQLSREYVILASTVLPKEIPGPVPIVFPPCSVLYVPAVRSPLREQMESYFAQKERPNFFGDGGRPLQNWYGNWWLPTAEVLIDMCRDVGFAVLEHQEIETDRPLGYALLLGR